MKTHKLIISAILISLIIISCQQGSKQISETQSSRNPTGNLIAKTYNSGFSLAHDTYNGLSAASDGKIYYVLCSQLIDIAGQMYSFDPKTGTIEHLGDLSEICGEQDMKVVA